MPFHAYGTKRTRLEAAVTFGVKLSGKERWTLTTLVLHHPHLQLDEAVGVEALVFSPAAVSDFMTTQVELALGT